MGGDGKGTHGELGFEALFRLAVRSAHDLFFVSPYHPRHKQ
jgi:hypothetical protein